MGNIDERVGDIGGMGDMNGELGGYMDGMVDMDCGRVADMDRSGAHCIFLEMEEVLKLGVLYPLPTMLPPS